ncbi:hypothetical protein NC653_026217 [Populus alba x Populus x berolinensis]|uniref:Uncharacterized protein n=1 Tax=Populus alba x Populus x berolinensis TaxID=444605 RepID=A0AAD6MD88_9ROSI|nr:hypothetical protein NC653_026217 [Populus alba x Populus x berolinensis]
MGKASYDGRFIRAPSPTLKARVCKGSIVIFKRIRFSLRAKILSRRVVYNSCGFGPHGDAPWYPHLLRRVKVNQNTADVKTHAHRYTARII